MRRVWLIGNGASLKDTPIDLIHEATMGVNKIGRIFRPDYYVKVDYSQFGSQWDDWKEEVLPMLGRPCLLWDVFRDGVKDPNEPFGDSIPVGIGDKPNVTWIPRCEHHGGDSARFHSPICTAYNSISVMVQWAEKLGYDEIFLTGCDAKYTDGKTDHFDENYYHEVDQTYTERNNRQTLAAHTFILNNCKLPIYDATVGGSLTCYPKVNIWDYV